MSTQTNPTPNRKQRRRLKAHFGFSKLPFNKAMWAKQMFDSQGQRELHDGLIMWTDIKGIAMVTGPSGVGKSITLRRFIEQLDEASFRVVQFAYLPTTPGGFLRSLARALGLPMRSHIADLFDDIHQYLETYQQENGPHPIIVLDDAEGLAVAVLDVIRRLTHFELDAEERFSLLITGTEQLLRTMRHPDLESLGSRINYAQTLRPFALEDARNYIRFHLDRADLDPKLFTDEAVKRIFQVSKGRPRAINQLATQALIQAAVEAREAIDGKFMANQIAAHPLYQTTIDDEA